MFTVNTSKGTFKIDFQHFNNPDDIRFTECHLLGENKEFLLKESAYCHENDNFNRSIGRKLSLTRMLELASKMVGFDKIDRQLVWDKYFELIGDTKTNNNKLDTIKDIVTALLNLADEYGNLNVVLPQVGKDVDGIEILWDANISAIVVEKDVDGKLVVRIF
jgi:hypothetical protein